MAKPEKRPKKVSLSKVSLYSHLAALIVLIAGIAIVWGQVEIIDYWFDTIMVILGGAIFTMAGVWYAMQEPRSLKGYLYLLGAAVFILMLFAVRLS